MTDIKGEEKVEANNVNNYREREASNVNNYREREREED